MPLIERKRQILKWLKISDTIIKNALKNRYKITKNDLKVTKQNISASFYDNKVNISIVKDIFERATFKSLEKIINHFKKKRWHCFICQKQTCITNKSNISICCDKCMCWSHLECTDINGHVPENEWFCSHCK